jgi:hypothetical protein
VCPFKWQNQNSANVLKGIKIFKMAERFRLAVLVGGRVFFTPVIENCGGEMGSGTEMQNDLMGTSG